MSEEVHQYKIAFRIDKIKEATIDARSFELLPVNDKVFSYEPGQFLTFLFQKRNGEEVRRNYSISSTPVLHEPVTITVKRIPNGEFSRQLIDHAKEGDLLTTIGASGFFTLPENLLSHQQVLFFAAGSGISPVFALIKTILYSYDQLKIVLVYSNASPQQTIFLKELRLLEQQFTGRFQIEFLFSNAMTTRHKRLGGYLLENLLQQYLVTGISNPLFYLCGPFEYMRMITIVLRKNGVPQGHIHKEVFVVDQPVKKAIPADQEPHNISLTLGGDTHQFITQYPQTILQTAKALNLPVPYSCESGQCGTCAATCISGKVWMWRNDVLLDDEIAKGRILTCTGYAVGGDVVLRY